MSTATLTNRCIAACQDGNGQVAYFAFEESYANNCDPHDPTWWCIAAGSYDAVLRHLCWRSGYHESGSTVSRRGPIRAEHALRYWQRLFDAPVPMEDHIITVGPDAAGTQRRGQAACLLELADRHDLAATMRGDGARFQLSKDLAALFGENTEFGKNRALRHFSHF